MNAASEIEAVNMALGAGAAGARAGTGSCGQGIALMQEAIAEAALNEVPFVVFNMARGQQDYFQCTRGGGWGDYRTITLAPKDVAEAVEHTQLLFHLADKYRAPVILYGDYLIADTYMSVDVARGDFGPLPAKDWALDGSRGGTGRSRSIWTWAMGKVNNPGLGPDGHWRRLAAEVRRHGRGRGPPRVLPGRRRRVPGGVVRARPAPSWTTWSTSCAPTACGSARSARSPCGPSPRRRWPTRPSGCRAVLVFEVNAGQMIDDVRLSVGEPRAGRCSSAASASTTAACGRASS